MHWVRSLASRLRKLPPLFADSAMAVVILAITLKLGWSSYPAAVRHRLDAFGLVLTFVANGAVAFRRRSPVAVFVISVAAFIAFEAGGYWLGMNALGPETAYFTIATLRSPRWIVATGLVLYPVLLFSNAHTWNGSIVDIAASSAVWLVALAVFGDRTRRLAEKNALIAEQAAQLAREQRQREQRAALDERVRIARELHDVLAHHLSVIAIQSGLASHVFATEPETARTALNAVRETTGEAFDEVRRLVAVLPPDPPGAAGGEMEEEAESDTGPPTPTEEDDTWHAHRVDQLPTLVQRVGAAGFPVAYTIVGLPQPLSAGIEMCIYRVTQEALTNVMKHAPGASVDVCLQYAPNRVSVRVTDTGRPIRVSNARMPPTRPRLPSSGRGLPGMRERASLYGGTVTAGRRTDGGFEVLLTLPVRIAASVDSITGPEGYEVVL